MEKNNKGVLVLIIILLLIFSTLSIWGFMANLNGVAPQPKPEPINREFKYDNKLHFYDMLTLIGTYECKTSLCDYATSTVDDANYSLNYYKNATDSQTSLIAKKYAFLTDGSEEIILYDIKNGATINTFKAIKNYQIGIDGNYYIVKDLNNKWGVMKLDTVADIAIDYKYDFIGLHNEIEEGKTLLNNEVFVVNDSNGWKLISNTDEDKTTYFANPIYDYNDKYVITVNRFNYYINGISNGNLLMENPFAYVGFVGDYVEVIDNDSDYYLLNPETQKVLSQKYKVTNFQDAKAEKTTDGISLYIRGELKEIVK